MTRKDRTRKDKQREKKVKTGNRGDYVKLKVIYREQIIRQDFQT